MWDHESYFEKLVFGCFVNRPSSNHEPLSISCSLWHWDTCSRSSSPVDSSALVGLFWCTLQVRAQIEIWGVFEAESTPQTCGSFWDWVRGVTLLSEAAACSAWRWVFRWAVCIKETPTQIAEPEVFWENPAMFCFIHFTCQWFSSCGIYVYVCSVKRPDIPALKVSKWPS